MDFPRSTYFAVKLVTGVGVVHGTKPLFLKQDRPLGMPLQNKWLVFLLGSCMVAEYSLFAVGQPQQDKSEERQQRQQHRTCLYDAQCLNGGKCILHDYGDEGSFLQCQCVQGYNGTRCEHYCPLVCQHGGVCHHSRAARWKGDSPTSELHESSDHLINGTVANTSTVPGIHDTDYSCKCMGYFTGKYCEIPYENCPDGSQCWNGGLCQVQTGDARISCVCPEGYSGQRCENATGARMSVPSGYSPKELSSSGRQKWIVTLWTLLCSICLILVSMILMHRRQKKHTYQSKILQRSYECYFEDDVIRGEAHLWYAREGKLWMNVI